MLQRHPLPSVVLFNQILTQLAELKHYSAVISLNNQMVVSRIRPNVYTLNIIMNCFCHLRKMGFGFSILGKFFRLGFEPIIATFNTLINGFIREHKEVDAAALFNKMMEGGICKPDVVTFNVLARGYCLKGNNTVAIQLLKKMEEGDYRTDVVVYDTIIDSLCKDTLVGIAPNVITYTSLIHGFCKVGNWKEATRLLNEMVCPELKKLNIREMEEKGCPSDGCTYNKIIQGFINNNETSTAVRLIE
ncbi:pentatricopeptide repeat-containing protein [Pyrus ussuriensis x Pyrus communis]|uniref:Pentatricopeptide repeat-containing protein n=1 Tax=Pyrus ussuriensis x Pyrus communis TaxID=2448454 RepID=A0A5N5FUA3_9ROSA|nr:pentatricopeptide repeat-containing protein [Pyrus ussuriensis x Pyrus communis]